MKILIAPDSFKDCLSAIDVAQNIEIGIRRVFPHATIAICPMADGGEGTVVSTAVALKLPFEEVSVSDPLGRSVKARFLKIENSALIEMAEASGLERLHDEERNPMLAHTFGTGELIRRGLDMGIRDFTVTVGGSATVDGGMGMAAALGYRFLDSAQKELLPMGQSLTQISFIDSTAVDTHIGASSFRVATDVSSPLLGRRGAARQFGPQKGATLEMVQLLENGLANLQACLVGNGMLHPASMAGDGAAGGMGMGIRGFLNGTIVSGAQTVAELVGLETHLEGADFVVTGEGRTDGQSSSGKLCGFVEKVARERNVSAIMLSGQITEDAAEFVSRFKVAKSITPAGTPLAGAIENAPLYLQKAATETFRELV